MKPSFYFYANPFQPRSLEAAQSLARCMQRHGAQVYTEPWLSDQGVGAPMALDEISSALRAVVAFGGDGTLLRAADLTAQHEIPLLGVHTGTVGFLMAGDAAKPEETAGILMQDSYQIDAYPLLEIHYQGGRYWALNDLSLTRGEHPGVIEVCVSADGERVMTAHGDGVVVSTPLGATAYSLSAGGPIVRPDTACLLITPIAARELLLRPVVLPLQARVVLQAHGRDRRRLQLAIDGQTLLPITEEAAITISQAAETARFIHPRNRCFFATLRQKQGVWNQEEEQE